MDVWENKGWGWRAFATKALNQNGFKEFEVKTLTRKRCLIHLKASSNL